MKTHLNISWVSGTIRYEIGFEKFCKDLNFNYEITNLKNRDIKKG
jgi:hypothetical protein